MGKKYTIELEDEPFYSGSGEKLWRVKGFNSLVFDNNGLTKLREFENQTVEYQTGDIITTKSGKFLIIGINTEVTC